MLFDIKRPSPVPVVEFVANFVNSLGNISESMPPSVSDIFTTISLLFFFNFSANLPILRFSVITINIRMYKHTNKARGVGFEPTSPFEHGISNPTPYQARRPPLIYIKLPTHQNPPVLY